MGRETIGGSGEDKDWEKNSHMEEIHWQAVSLTLVDQKAKTISFELLIGTTFPPGTLIIGE